ncbi:hypothetical protein [Kingella potus]|nr:hypothetical protein [Kingella potus]
MQGLAWFLGRVRRWGDTPYVGLGFGLKRRAESFFRPSVMIVL